MALRRNTAWPRVVAPTLLVVGIAAPGAWYELAAGGGTGASSPETPAEVAPADGPDVVGRPVPQRGPSPPPPAVAPEDPYRCRVPDVAVERTAGCGDGLPYPDCKWRVPDPDRADNLYLIWRNTTDQRRSARPALVGLVLAAAEDYARHYPGELLAVGDLDAQGPRHETHDKGQDVDLYLPGMMASENLGGGEYADNYDRLPSLSRRMVRARVETLARILAECTEGRVRIYYNDPPVRERFLRWYGERGWESPWGQPMQAHNDLHRFHFHVTIPEDMEPLPFEGGRT